jgi:hypothetical protein
LKETLDRDVVVLRNLSFFYTELVQQTSQDDASKDLNTIQELQIKKAKITTDVDALNQKIKVADTELATIGTIHITEVVLEIEWFCCSVVS